MATYATYTDITQLCRDIALPWWQVLAIIAGNTGAYVEDVVAPHGLTVDRCNAIAQAYQHWATDDVTLRIEWPLFEVRPRVKAERPPIDMAGRTPERAELEAVYDDSPLCLCRDTELEHDLAGHAGCVVCDCPRFRPRLPLPEGVT